MCGIAGFITSKRGLSNKVQEEMTNAIAHRGPDAAGHWNNKEETVFFGHRRLSILDLSPAGSQPMHYLDRYTIVFNGEIYNYLELRETLELAGYTFKSDSDTEVLLACYDHKKEHCLQDLDGMFAFAIYDSVKQTVFIARDRFGEKPLFYAYVPGAQFVFGSELKVLWAAGIPKVWNERMIFNYLDNGAIDNPSDLTETFFENCFRLEHSHYLTLKLADLSIQIKRYYDINWRERNRNITEAEAKLELRDLFYKSVSRRLRSDVPVGSSLSGGLDSSLVVTVIDKLIAGSGQIQKTFSAVFPGFKKDESKYIDLVVKKTAVEPHFVTPDDEGMLTDFQVLCHHQEEPFGSASIYVQYCVMKLAKENNVTVLLDGQGADELLAGYHGYYTAYFNDLKTTDKRAYQKEFEHYLRVHQDNNINPIQKKGKGARIKELVPFAYEPLLRFYKAMTDKAPAKFDAAFLKRNRSNRFTPLPSPSSLSEALYRSTMKGEMQQLLRYADRNSMAHSREVRLPFLNHELVEFIFSLPDHFKIKEGWTKWIMRFAFDEELPPEITWRKDKIGYEPPQNSWMDSEEVKKSTRKGLDFLVQQRVLKTGAELDEASKWRISVLSHLLN